MHKIKIHIDIVAPRHRKSYANLR